MIHHLTRATRHLIVWSLLAAAVGLTALRLGLMGVENYKTVLADKISAEVGLPVSIGRLSAKMRGINPELLVRDITFADAADKPVIQLQEMRLGISLADLLLARAWLPSIWVTLVGVKMSVVRKPDGSLSIAGLKASEGDPLWLLEGHKYELLDSDITWLDLKHPSRPLALKPVDMVIINDGGRHRINADVHLPDKLGSRLRVSMDLSGNFFLPASVNGDLYVEAERLDLPQWLADGLPSGINVSSGIGSGQFWLKLSGSQAVSVRGNADLQALAVHRVNGGALPVSRVHSHWQWTRAGLEQRLDLLGLQWTDNAKATGQPQTFKTTVRLGVRQDGNGGWQTLALSADRLDLQAVSGLVQFFDALPEPYRRWLAQAQLAGDLQNLRAFADVGQQRFAVDSRFNRVAMASVNGLPGFAGLSGRVSGTDRQGVLEANLARNTVFLPQLLPLALPVSELKSHFQWRQNDRQWQLLGTYVDLVLPGCVAAANSGLIGPRKPRAHRSLI